MTMETQKHLSTEERRQEIAAAARDLIVEKGLDGLRTRDVAARVGINVATLHYHVPSKDKLIELVLESIRALFIEQGRLVDESGLDPLDRLKLEIAEYRHLLTEKPEMLQLFEELAKRARVDTVIEPKIRQMRIAWNGRFVAILREGCEKGQFRSSLDPEAVAHIIIGALVSFQYKPRHLLPLFDSVTAEIIRSIQADQGKTSS